MTTFTETRVATQVYRVYIKATPETVWEAITSPSGPSGTATTARSSTTCARAVPTGVSPARR